MLTARHILAAGCLAFLSAVARAQASDVPVKLNIPQQPMHDALNALAEQTGLQIAFAIPSVEGRIAPRIQGQYTPQAALKILLSGTQLSYEFINDKTIAIRPAVAATGSSSSTRGEGQGEPPATLLAQAETAGDAPNPSSADSKSAQSPGGDSAGADEAYDSPFAVQVVTVNGTRYGVDRTTSGRLAQKYIDTPQAVSVVTSELLKDANIYDSMDALKFVPNVQVNSAHAPATTIRGITSNNNTYTDGFLSSPSIGGIFDPSFADRIEVVKGPSSASFGRGNPSGFINYVLKSPLYTQSTEVDAMIGTGGTEADRRIIVDNNGLLSDDGRTAYRAVFVHHRGSETLDDSTFERNGALLSVDRKLGDRGTLRVNTNVFKSNNPGLRHTTAWFDPTFRYQQFRLVNRPDPGLPMLDPDTAFSVNDSGNVYDGFTGTATLNYKLSEHWSTRQAVQSNQVRTDSIWLYITPTNINVDTNGQFVADNTLMNPNTWGTRSLNYQSDFLWKRPSEFLNSTYTVLFGGDYSDIENRTVVKTATLPRQQLFAFNRAISPATFATVVNSRSQAHQKSWYAQVGASFLGGMIQPSAAVRKVYFENESKNLVNGVTTVAPDTKTPLFGTYTLLIKPREWLSIYAQTSKYQEPATQRLRYSNLPPGDSRASELVTVQPTTELEEAGVKGNFFDDAIVFSVAAFKVKSFAVAKAFQTAFPEYPGQLFPTWGLSDDEITGWELEMFGRPGRHFQYMFGAGKIDSEATFAIGTSLIKVPTAEPDTLYANVKYSFGPSEDEGVSVRAGGKIYFSGWNANAAPVAAYTDVLPYPHDIVTVDLGVSYGFAGGRYKVDLSAKNAFHEKTQVLPGSGFNWTSGRIVYLGFDTKL